MKLVRLSDNIHFMQIKFELLFHFAIVNPLFSSFPGCRCIKAKEELHSVTAPLELRWNSSEREAVIFASSTLTHNVVAVFVMFHLVMRRQSQ